MYSSNAYHCCFATHSIVAAQLRQTDQLHQGDPEGVKEGPTRIRSERQTWVDMVRLTAQAESEGLSFPKKQKKRLAHIYIYIHIALQGADLTRSP